MKSERERLPVPEKTLVLGRKAYYIVSLCLIAAVFLLFWQYKNVFERGGIDDSLIVKTQLVGPKRDAPGFAFSGKVRGRYEIPLSFSASGRISEINTSPGAQVKPGDILLRLAAEAPAEDPVREKNGGAGQADLLKAEADFKRYEALYKQGAISRVMYERFQSVYAAAQAAAQRMTSGEGSLRANAQAATGVLRADHTGVVLGIEAKTGDRVNAGQMVLLLAKEGAKEVEFDVPENQFDEFAKLESIKVALTELPDVVLQGKIRDWALVSAAEGNHVKVRMTLLNPPPEVRFGMTASIAAGGPGALRPDVVVPLKAVVQKDAAPAVWVVQDNSVVLRRVKLRSLDQEQVRIVDGLEEGETIVVSGVQTLQEGSLLK